MDRFLYDLFGAAVSVAESASIQRAEGSLSSFIEEPFTKPPGQVHANLDPILVIEKGGSRGELFAIGLSTIKYKYEVNPINSSGYVEISLVSLDATVDNYNVEGWINATPFQQETIPSGPFEGAGKATFSASNVILVAKADLVMGSNGGFSIRKLIIEEIDFENISIDLGDGFLLCGAPINWVEWSKSFKTNFKADWARNKDEVVENIRLAANSVLEKYTLTELQELIKKLSGHK